ncbi:hypothetical protein VTO73DRAFT_1270 [Trametes versicolor]
MGTITRTHRSGAIIRERRSGAITTASVGRDHNGTSGAVTTACHRPSQLVRDMTAFESVHWVDVSHMDEAGGFKKVSADKEREMSRLHRGEPATATFVPHSKSGSDSQTLLSSHLSSPSTSRTPRTVLFAPSARAKCPQRRQYESIPPPRVCTDRLDATSADNVQFTAPPCTKSRSKSRFERVLCASRVDSRRVGDVAGGVQHAEASAYIPRTGRACETDGSRTVTATVSAVPPISRPGNSPAHVPAVRPAGLSRHEDMPNAAHRPVPRPYLRARGAGPPAFVGSLQRQSTLGRLPPGNEQDREDTKFADVFSPAEHHSRVLNDKLPWGVEQRERMIATVQ